MTRTIAIDDELLLAIEQHETHAHALPSREVRDLGDSLVLHDPRDPDPFWNRMVSVRWPDDDAAFEHRLNEALALFALLRRSAHVWPSPVHSRPADLVARLMRHGFRDVGGGHVMVLGDPASTPPVGPSELPRATTMVAIGRSDDAGGSDLEDIGLVLAESFGAPAWRAPGLAADLGATLDDPRVLLVLARVDGEPAAVAKATTFDGLTYLSSIGTREAFRGRGLGRLVTRQAIAVAARDSRLAYLGVWSGNAPALRVYGALGFASIGEAPDLLLE
ncbi:MAG TPA: GNAT family N-acetyltransferase [Candidatus Limnocylindrales bacterium]|nr:GNAT family N-acetyltransferase [Candidatus Limnocylindrales bacterium]